MVSFYFLSRSLFTGLFLSRWSHRANTPQLWQLPQEWPLPRGPLLSSSVPLPNSMPSWQHTQHHRYTDCLHKSWNGIFCHITLWYPVVDVVEKCIYSSTVKISSNLNIFSSKYSYIIPNNMIIIIAYHSLLQLILADFYLTTVLDAGFNYFSLLVGCLASECCSLCVWSASPLYPLTVICPVYPPVLGGVSLESCSTCPAGYFCSTEGLASPSGPCAAGFYCPFDFSSTTPYAFLCPKVRFCFSPCSSLRPPSFSELPSPSFPFVLFLLFSSQYLS